MQQRGTRILPQFKPDIVGWLMDALEAADIDLRPETAVTAIEKRESRFTIQAVGNGGNIAFEAVVDVLASGRVPAIDRLNFEGVVFP